MTTYSDRLYIGDVTPGAAFVTLQTVPAGERWVLRDIRLRSSVTGKLVQLDVQESGGAEGKIVRRTFADTDVYRETECRPTLRAGDKLRLYADASTTITVYVSGYRLSTT